MAEAVEPAVAEAHPELHHYTTWAGLQGILESNALWAVRYDCMNDPTEFAYAKNLLVGEQRQFVG